MKTILGTKIGMTQIFSDNGEAIPVTVVSAGPCFVTQIKTVATDGYNAIQVGYGTAKERKITKPVLGHIKKSNTQQMFAQLREFRIDKPDETQPFQLGQAIKCDIFSPGDFVDVRGISKGLGFQGVVKRHGFGGGPTTHGQSDKQRAPGAIGPQRPQKTRKGKKMAGRMGGKNLTIQKLQIVKTIPEKNILLIKGAIPGVKNGQVVISSTIKKVKPKPVTIQKEIKKIEPKPKTAKPIKK